MAEAGGPEESGGEAGPTRRGLLKRGLFAGLALGLGGLTAQQLSGYALEDELRARLVSLSAREFIILRAAAARILRADGEGAPGPDELDVTLWLDGYLSRQPSWVAGEVGTLLLALEHAGPVLDLSFSRFTRMSGAQQDAVLEAWATSALSLRKQGFQALKGLCVMGYYRHPKSWRILGYDGPLIKGG